MSESPSSFHQDGDENLSVFHSVIAAIKFEAIPTFASSIRQERDRKDGTLTTPWQGEDVTASIDCAVSSKALYGSFNILYAIDFADGIRWLVKIPANGYRGRWTQADARSTASEARTMQLIKRRTSIPVPEVFTFESTLNNDLNCPFILMEFIEGIPLYDFWFDESHSPTEIEQRRTRILGEIATAVTQLNQFRYAEGGSISFDEDGNPVIAPLQCTDQQTVLENIDPEDGVVAPTTFEAGPFKRQQDYFLSHLDRHEPPPDKFSRGFHQLLRLLLSWVPYSDDTEKCPFVLTHPDFDIQNILVSSEGTLQCVIDWDGVAALPSCYGNERYPGWLTRDWDPAMYGYQPPISPEEHASEEIEGANNFGEDEDTDGKQTREPKADNKSMQEHPLATEHALEKELSAQSTDQDPLDQAAGLEVSDQADAPEIGKENSPEELSRYRELYRGFIAAVAKNAYPHSPENGTKDATEAVRSEGMVRLTRNSLMVENLSIAANNPVCRDQIIEKIFEEIARITEDEYQDPLESEESSEIDEGEQSGVEIEGDQEAHPSKSDVVEEGEEAIESSESPTGDAQSIGGRDETASETNENDDDAPVECFDFGTFDFGDVALALADGELDEARLKRLKAGFAAFCS